MPNEALTADQLKTLQDIAKKIRPVSSEACASLMKWIPISLSEIFLADQVISTLIDDYPAPKVGVHLIALGYAAVCVFFPVLFALEHLQLDKAVHKVISNTDLSFNSKKCLLEGMLSGAESFKKTLSLTRHSLRC